MNDRARETELAPARVLAVDDHRTFTDLVGVALADEPDLEYVGAAHDRAEARRLVSERQPDVVLDAFGFFERADRRPAGRPSRAPGRGAHRPRRRHRDASAAAAVGVCALLAKDGSLPDLLAGLRGARLGGLVVHPELLRTLVVAEAEPGQPARSRCAHAPRAVGPAAARGRTPRRCDRQGPRRARSAPAGTRPCGALQAGGPLPARGRGRGRDARTGRCTASPVRTPSSSRRGRGRIGAALLAPALRGLQHGRGPSADPGDPRRGPADREGTRHRRRSTARDRDREAVGGPARRRRGAGRGDRAAPSCRRSWTTACRTVPCDTSRSGTRRVASSGPTGPSWWDAGTDFPGRSAPCSGRPAPRRSSPSSPAARTAWSARKGRCLRCTPGPSTPTASPWSSALPGHRADGGERPHDRAGVRPRDRGISGCGPRWPCRWPCR